MELCKLLRAQTSQTTQTRALRLNELQASGQLSVSNMSSGPRLAPSCPIQAKFVIDRDGQVFKYYSPKPEPQHSAQLSIVRHSLVSIRFAL